MANTDNARGFIHPQTNDGGPVVLKEYTAASQIFVGDPCLISTTGTVARVGNGDDATAFDAICTSFASTAAIAAGNSTVHLITDLSRYTFEIQADAALAADVRGQEYGLTQAAGDTTTGYSGCELDVAVAGAGGNVRVVDMINRPDNDNTLTNSKVRVEFAEWANAPTVS